MLLMLAAAAATALAPNSTPYTDAKPPTRFQGNATVTVQFAGVQTIASECEPHFGKPPPGMVTQACDIGQRIVIPNPCSVADSDAYAKLLCHELGHVNGWPATHGDFPDLPQAASATPQPVAPPADIAAAATGPNPAHKVLSAMRRFTGARPIAND